MTMKIVVKNDDATRIAVVTDEQYSVGKVMPDRTDTVAIGPGESRVLGSRGQADHRYREAMTAPDSTSKDSLKRIAEEMQTNRQAWSLIPNWAARIEALRERLANARLVLEAGSQAELQSSIFIADLRSIAGEDE